MRHPIRPLQHSLALIQANQLRPADTAAQDHRLTTDHGYRPAAMAYQHRLQAEASGNVTGAPGIIGRGQPGGWRTRRICRLGQGRAADGKKGEGDQPHRVSHVLSGLRV